MPPTQSAPKHNPEFPWGLLNNVPRRLVALVVWVGLLAAGYQLIQPLDYSWIGFLKLIAALAVAAAPVVAAMMIQPRGKLEQKSGAAASTRNWKAVRQWLAMRCALLLASIGIIVVASLVLGSLRHLTGHLVTTPAVYAILEIQLWLHRARQHNRAIESRRSP